MAITITTRKNGEITGPTMADIIDEYYGAGAFAAQGHDPNRAEWGQVLRRVEHSSYSVEDIIVYVEGEPDTVDAEESLAELRSITTELYTLSQRRDQLTSERDLLIRQVARAGVPIKTIMDASDLSRARVSSIKNA